MKFYVSVRSERLKSAVALLRKFKPKRHVVASGMVRVRLAARHLQFIVSDGDIQLSVPVPIEGPACGEEIILSRSDLFDIAKEAEHGTPVRFDAFEHAVPVSNAGEDTVIHRHVEIQFVTQGFASKRRCGLYASDDVFDLLEVAGRRIPFSSRHVAALRLSARFSSTDETRHVINGACLDPVHAGRLISTDGRRMLIQPIRSPGRPLIVPNAVLHILRHKDLHTGALFTHEDPGDPSATVRASLRFGATAEISFACLDGRYPNWQQVIPSKDARTGSIAITPATAARLITWLRAKRNMTLILEPLQRSVRITRHPTAAKDQDHKEIITVPAGILDAPPAKVGFDAAFFAECLDAGLHTLDLIDDMSPGIFTDGTARCILMPMRLPAAAPSAADEADEDEEETEAAA